MEINALGRLKMLFQRPYISKPSGGHATVLVIATLDCA